MDNIREAVLDIPLRMFEHIGENEKIARWYE